MDERKVRDYLLAPEHPIGRAKARFFNGLGFYRDRWQELRDILLMFAREGPAEPSEVTPFGQKYLMGAILSGPSGRSAAIQTVWIVPEDGIPRFVTAYPANRP